MDGGGLVAGAGFGSVVVVVVVEVAGEFGAGAEGAVVVLVGNGLAGAGLEAGVAVVCALEDGGATDVVGETGTCPAAKLHAASDSATKQTGRSTRFM